MCTRKESADFRTFATSVRLSLSHLGATRAAARVSLPVARVATCYHQVPSRNHQVESLGEGSCTRTQNYVSDCLRTAHSSRRSKDRDFVPDLSSESRQHPSGRRVATSYAGLRYSRYPAFMDQPWRHRLATVASHVLGRWASELRVAGSQ
eukprot:scaffold602871_cov48-Prasinocladus_malaysianus.AAC.1